MNKIFSFCVLFAFHAQSPARQSLCINSDRSDGRGAYEARTLCVHGALWVRVLAAMSAVDGDGI